MYFTSSQYPFFGNSKNAFEYVTSILGRYHKHPKVYIKMLIRKASDPKKYAKSIESDPYNLYNPITHEKFKFELCEFFIGVICELGYINFLEWWKNNYVPFNYDTWSLTWASKSGHVDVFDWWKNNGLELGLSCISSLETASEEGHVDVLEWWKNSGCPLDYSEYTLNKASKNGHINVLEWWKNSGLELKYSYNAFCLARNSDPTKHIKVLDWWLSSGLEFKYPKYPEFAYDCVALDVASKYGYINVLDWWLNSGLELENYYSEAALNNASRDGNINVLNWWVNSNLPLDYDEKALDFASSNGHINVLDWWFYNISVIEYSENSLILASINGHINVLNWWLNSGLPLKCRDNIIIRNKDQCHRYKFDHSSDNYLYVPNSYIETWWEKSGLLIKNKRFDQKFFEILHQPYKLLRKILNKPKTFDKPKT